MRNILVPVDGSEPSMRALHVAIARASAMGSTIHVLHIEPPIPASVGDFVGNKAVGDFQAEEAEKSLAPAREALAASGVPFEVVWRSGSPSEAIAAYCAETGCEEIVMGSRGLGRISGLLLGSVTTQVLTLASVPVTLVK